MVFPTRKVLSRIAEALIARPLFHLFYENAGKKPGRWVGNAQSRGKRPNLRMSSVAADRHNLALECHAPAHIEQRRRSECCRCVWSWLDWNWLI